MAYQEQISVLRNENNALKQRVGKLERTVAFLLEQLKLEYVDSPPIDPSYPEVQALVRSGKKLDAIKLYRQQSGADMDNAKRFVETLE